MEFFILKILPLPSSPEKSSAIVPFPGSRPRSQQPQQQEEQVSSEAPVAFAEPKGDVGGGFIRTELVKSKYLPFHQEVCLLLIKSIH